MPDLIELLTYYVIGGALIIGPPAIFLIIAMMAALQNTKGRMVGYKDHKIYGNSSIYDPAPKLPREKTKFFLELPAPKLPREKTKFFLELDA